MDGVFLLLPEKKKYCCTLALKICHFKWPMIYQDLSVIFIWTLKNAKREEKSKYMQDEKNTLIQLVYRKRCTTQLKHFIQTGLFEVVYTKRYFLKTDIHRNVTACYDTASVLKLGMPVLLCLTNRKILTRSDISMLGKNDVFSIV